MKNYIISLDQGTTSCRAVLFNKQGKILGISQQEITQYYPKPSWVEHDPKEIYSIQYKVLDMVIKQHNIKTEEIAAIGITNQRETVLIWDRSTGKPIYNAIVWQDKRTTKKCEELKMQGKSKMIQEISGLVIDSYFSATKIEWLLDNVEGARKKAEQGDLCCGTIDSWLIWNLSGGNKFVTDYTNASRTMLFNIKNLCWDTELLDIFSIPKSILPEVNPSDAHHCDLDYEGNKIPIMSILGDQQAALFGQACFNSGDAKNTYGTGCFLLMNTANKCKISQNNLLSTIAWGLDNKVSYALEGSVFIAGALVQWLRDGLGIITKASDTEQAVQKAVETEQLVVVPAFSGLGAPYWDMYARGAIFGLSIGTKKNEIIKASLEAIAFQARDILEAMQKDSGVKLTNLNVDGGAAQNSFLMQFQSDILGVPINLPNNLELTAFGAAFMAGISSGIWKENDIHQMRTISKVYKPQMTQQQRKQVYQVWHKAVERTRGWLKD